MNKASKMFLSRASEPKLDKNAKEKQKNQETDQAEEEGPDS